MSLSDFCLFSCWNFCKKLETNSLSGTRLFIIQADVLPGKNFYTRSIFPGKSLSLCRPFSKSFSGWGLGEVVFQKTRKFSWKTKGFVLKESKLSKWTREYNVYANICIFFLHYIVHTCIKNYFIFKPQKKKAAKSVT